MSQRAQRMEESSNSPLAGATDASSALAQSGDVGEPGEAPHLSAGERVGHFRIERLIGEGAMGQVYLAQDETLDRQVALKLVSTELASSPEALARFQTEARATAKINHPNIVTIHAVGEHRGRPYVALEYVKGRTLREQLAEQKMSLEAALAMLTEVADAVAAAHAQGVWHRDLKPTNVLINDSGRAKVLDFGLAKISGRDAELAEVGSAANLQATTAGGTPLYMAPEQWRGEPSSAATDVWALGVLLYEVCTRQHPFLNYRQGEEAAEVAARLRDSVCSAGASPSMSQQAVVPDKLAQLVAACLSKPPAERPSAEQVVAALRELTPGATAMVAASAEPATERTGRGAQLMAGAALFVAVAVGGVVLGTLARQDEAPEQTRNGAPGPLLDVQAQLSAAAATAAAPSTAMATTPSTATADTTAMASASSTNSASAGVATSAGAKPSPPKGPPPRPTSGRCSVATLHCGTAGRCTRRGNRCIATSASHCRQSTNCYWMGKCQPRNGECVAASEADCQKSRYCSIDGRCHPQGGVCVPKSDSDCQQSSRCNHKGLCKLVGSACVKGGEQG